MSSNATEVLEKINTLRNKPSIYKKTLQVVGKAMKRVKKAALGRELEDFAQELATKDPISPLVLSPILNKLCEDELALMIKNKKDSAEIEQDELFKKASKLCKGFKKIFMAYDQGGIDFIIARMCISEFDPKRHNKKNFMDADYSYIGVASCQLPGEEDEEGNVIMLADHVDEIDNTEFHFDDFSELRKAFQAFDVNKSGTLDPKELKGALRSINFDRDSPFEWSVIEKLDNYENNKNGIDFKKFCIAFDNCLGDVHTEEGLKNLFNAFINDINQDYITSTSIKRLLQSLNLPIDNDEVEQIISQNSSNGREIRFPEFYECVKNFYDDPDKCKLVRRGTLSKKNVQRETIKYS
jgi:Ca2+-binding EF-hand superfamily protein